MSLESVFTRAWQQQSAWLWGLAPLSWFYGGLFKLNKFCHDCGIKAVYHAPVPVIVIGNINVGGSGKTPFIIALIEYLHKLGLTIGVISRGYGGQVDKMPLLVTTDSSPDVVGDEPALIVRQTGVAMAVCPNRQQAIELLLEHHADIRLILSDDGLQHHALHRDAEWIVVDVVRGFGNRQLLPMGYLREPVSRLLDNVSIDSAGMDNVGMDNVGMDNAGIQTELLFHVTGLDGNLKYHITQLAPNLHTLPYLSQTSPLANIPTMTLCTDNVISLSAWASHHAWETQMNDDGQCLQAQGLQAQGLQAQCLQAQAVIAMTGIGYPKRFFNSLSKLGFSITPVILPDHHQYAMTDFIKLNNLPKLPIIVTTKDAIKIFTLFHHMTDDERQFWANWQQRIWVLPITADLSTAVYQRLHQQLQALAIL